MVAAGRRLVPTGFRSAIDIASYRSTIASGCSTAGASTRRTKDKVGLPSGWDGALLLWGCSMSASKFFNSSTLGGAGGSFPFEKLIPWAASSFEAPDFGWEPDDREEFDRFVAGDFVLTRPPRPAFDHLEAFLEAEDEDKNEGTAHLRTLFRQSHRFLVTHDWARAFAGDRDFDDRGSEFRLPAPNCCFSFYMPGKHILALISEQAIGANGSLAFADETDHFLLGVQLKSRDWVLFGQAGRNVPNGVTRLFAFIFRNIKAACISLEAKIAETEVIRAPYKLNVARVRRGKLPISDYHIINLANRARVAPLPLDHELSPHRSPRLHFRRGHWRHLVNHKTWIKWTLVGDADLGFIDKEYRL
jgi:hypothetical protein